MQQKITIQTMVIEEEKKKKLKVLESCMLHFVSLIKSFIIIIGFIIFIIFIIFLSLKK